MSRLLSLFKRNAGELARPPHVTCSADTPLQELLVRMRDSGSSHAVVLRDQRQVRGLITPDSLLRHLADRGPGSARAGDALEPDPYLVPSTEPLYRLVGPARGSSPVVVVDEHGALRGTILSSDLFGLLAPAALMDHRPGPHELAAMKASQLAAVRDLLDEGLAATDVQQVLSAMNDDLCRRAVESTIAGLQQDGWGTPPARFCLLLMGSGGRGESLLAPDQDNGLVIEDYPDSAHGSIDRYFAEFAERFTLQLDRAGIPLCAGHVMASNPLWRKTGRQWHDQVHGWIRRRSPQALLNACILLDVRGVVGDLGLATALRDDIRKSLGAAPGFLRALMVNESTKQVGLGWFDRLLTEGDDSPHAGQFNIKRNGIMPIVEAARLYALACDIGTTSTVQRLAALRERNALDADEHDDLHHAFDYMCQLLLRQQIADLEAARPAGRHVAPDGLRRREHERLVRALKASEALLRKVRQTLLGSGND